MGNSFQSSKYHDNRHELVVFGYTREQSSIANLDHSIPYEIQRLCSEFYYQDCYLFLTIGSLGGTRKDFHSIQCLNIKSRKTFDIVLRDLEQKEVDILHTEEWDKMFYGECIQQNVSLPQWILNGKYSGDDIDPHRRYNIIYRVAGASGKNLQLTDTTHAIIYNTDELRKGKGKGKGKINAYYCNMPSLEQHLTSVTSVLDKKRNSIYAVGRSEYGINCIHQLDLNESELKWKKHKSVLESKIFGVGVTVIDNTHYNEHCDSVMMICGGRDITRNMVDTVKIINLNTSSVIHMNSMNYKRAYFNCVPYRDNREYIVGGGYEECKTLEIFDIDQDKWRIIPQQTNYQHNFNSCLFMDNCNENIVYICGKKLGYDQLRNLGHIEWCDLRENTHQFHVLHNKSIANLFDIKGSNVTDKWESRSLLF